MATHVFGIRHHGPGSARSLCKALRSLQPDVVLIEGPPDADDVVSLAIHADMTPPVAILVYDPEAPHRAVYYPFALFSPEWQAIQFALKNEIPVRFMDLPQTHALALSPDKEDIEASDEAEAPSENGPSELPEPTPEERIRMDPLQALAEAAGYADGERWWEQMVEQRRDGRELFQAIGTAMASVRSEVARAQHEQTDTEQARREAYMRTTIRKARKDGFEQIAVVCGAWHAPVLPDGASETEDRDILKGLPKTKVAATWVPWTHGRLSRYSGYGAGVESPGWYEHLWAARGSAPSRWLTKTARFLREKGLDVSSAHVIESTRLAEALTALRERPAIGLSELTEATRTVMLFGDDLALSLIERELIVGEKIGRIPDDTPMVPLQRDLHAQQKRLRLKVGADTQDLVLDLRKDIDRARSILLRRLGLLGIEWAEGGQRASGRGTFKEAWRLQWKPELAVKIIEAAVWGGTVETAASARTRRFAADTTHLPALCEQAVEVLLADLPRALTALVARVQTLSAVASDVTHLMDSLPPLARMMRYGDVRETDTRRVATILDGMVSRVCVGLPGACHSLNDDAAQAMVEHIEIMHDAVSLLNTERHLDDWSGVLDQVMGQSTVHGLVRGRCCRLLFDRQRVEREQVASLLSLALSVGTDPVHAASWLVGFLRGSGQVLLLDEELWDLVDAWVTGLTSDFFQQILPILRRSFSSFSQPERRQMGERVTRTAGAGSQRKPSQDEADTTFDTARADAVLPLLEKILGLS